MISKINPLIIPFDELFVTNSKREYKELLTSWGVTSTDLKGLSGHTTTVRGKGCAIWISKKLKGTVLYGVASHEATHAMLNLLELIGENNPGSEEMAYMVQSITTGIILVCQDNETYLN